MTDRVLGRIQLHHVREVAGRVVSNVVVVSSNFVIVLLISGLRLLPVVRNFEVQLRGVVQRRSFVILSVILIVSELRLHVLDLGSLIVVEHPVRTVGLPIHHHVVGGHEVI